MSQKPRPLVPAIQPPPPPAPPPFVELAMSGASAVTRPSSAGLRNSVHRPRTGSRQPSCSGVAATSVSARSVSATIGVRSAGCAATSGGTATVFSPGASRPRPPAVPTQTLSRTATRLRTGVSLQTLTTDPSSLTTNSPRTLPTHTPSGAGASAAAPSSANSLILVPGASTRTTPRSHASQSDRPRAISRRPSTQGNPSVPVPSIVVSADRSRATHVNPRRSPTRPADATHTPPGAAARDDPLLPGPDGGVVARPPVGWAEPHRVGDAIRERDAHAGRRVTVERRDREAPTPRLPVVDREPVGRGGEHAERGRRDRFDRGEIADQGAVFGAPTGGLSDGRTVGQDGGHGKNAQSDCPTVRPSDSSHSVSGNSSSVSTGGPTGIACAHARQMSGSAASTSARRRLRAVP